MSGSASTLIVGKQRLALGAGLRLDPTPVCAPPCSFESGSVGGSGSGSGANIFQVVRKRLYLPPQAQVGPIFTETAPGGCCGGSGTGGQHTLASGSAPHGDSPVTLVKRRVYLPQGTNVIRAGCTVAPACQAVCGPDSGSSGGPGPGLVTPCCPGVITPARLYANFSGAGLSCAVAGVTLPINLAPPQPQDVWGDNLFNLNNCGYGRPDDNYWWGVLNYETRIESFTGGFPPGPTTIKICNFVSLLIYCDPLTLLWTGCLLFTGSYTTDLSSPCNILYADSLVTNLCWKTAGLNFLTLSCDPLLLQVTIPNFVFPAFDPAHYQTLHYCGTACQGPPATLTLTVTE